MHWTIWNNKIEEKEMTQVCGHLFLAFGFDKKQHSVL